MKHESTAGFEPSSNNGCACEVVLVLNMMDEAERKRVITTLLAKQPAGVLGVSYAWAARGPAASGSSAGRDSV